MTAISPARTATRRRGRFPVIAIAFMAPFLALYLIFTILPLLYSFRLSLFTEKAAGGLGFGGSEEIFVGFENFGRALADERFTTSFGNVAAYCVVYIPIMIGLALVVALLLDSVAAKAKSFFRLAIFVPHIVPGLIAAIIWLYLYTPGISPLIDAIEGAGGTWNLTSFLGAIFALTNLATWLHMGYNVILFYAALQSIPGEVLEAAKIDGAGPIRTALAIKLRMIGGAVTVAVLFTVVGAMQLFAEPLLLASRAPAIDSTWTPNMFIYHTAFVSQDMGYAAASAVLFAVVIGIASYLVTKLGRKAS